MPSSETIEMRKIKGTLGKVDDLPKSNPRSSVVSRIRALLLRVSAIPQLIHRYGALEPNKTLTLDVNLDKVDSLFSDGTYLYAGLHDVNAKIVKIDLETFTVVDTITFAVDYITSLVSDGTYLYASTDLFWGTIIKIDLATFAEVDSLDYIADDMKTLFSDGTFLYVGTFESPGKIKKFDLDTFTFVSTLTLSAGENEIRELTTDGTYLYAGLSLSPGKVVKIDLGTFTAVSTLTLDAGENDARALFSDGTYLYVGLSVTPGKIVKIDIETFTKVDSLTFAAGEGYIDTIFSDGTYLYAGLSLSPGKVVKINLATFTAVNTTTFNAGENVVRDSFSDGTYLYISLRTSPGKILRKYIIPASNIFERKIELIDEQVHSASHDVYPTLAAAVALTSSAVAWTQGAYTEVLPVSTIKNRFFITGIILNNMVIDSEYEVDIATGAGASEIVIATVSHETHDANLSCVIPISPPIKVSSNTRISARCASENAAGDTCTIKLMYKL